MADLWESLRGSIEGFFGVNLESKEALEAKMRKAQEMRDFVNKQSEFELVDNLVKKGLEILHTYNLDQNNPDLYSVMIIDTMSKNATAQEITLALSAYVEKIMDPKRAEQLASNLLPAMERVAKVAENKQTFTLADNSDKRMSEVMINLIRAKIEACRSIEEISSVDIANDVQNGISRTDFYKEIVSGLVSDVIIGGEYWAREKGWEMFRNISLSTSVNVVIERLQSEPEWGAVLLEKELNLLVRKADFENDGDRASLDSILNVILEQKKTMTELGYWPYILEMLEKIQNKGSDILGDNPAFNDLRSEVAALQIEEKATKIIDTKLESKPLVQELRDEMGVSGVSRVLGEMKESDRVEFQNFLQTTKGELANEVISDLFNTSNSMDLSEDFFTARGEMRVKYQRVMLEPEVQNFMQAMLKLVYDREDDLEPDYDLEFRLAVLSACLPLDENKATGKKSTRKLNHESSDFCLRAKNNDWYLCDMSEHRLLSAMLVDGAILVNDHFILKFDGKKAALCLDRFEDANGDIFYPGVWYAVTDKESKKELAAAYTQGKMKCKIDGISFAVMRTVAKDDSDYSGVDGALLMAALKNYRDRCREIKKPSVVRKPLGSIVEANNR